MCGYNGRGIASCTTFGRVIAENVMGRMNAPAMPLPLSPVDDWPFLAWELNYEAEAQGRIWFRICSEAIVM
ncbi:hypothetical protein HFO97_07835 [Rhizobium leguminosarum]|uniref:hypothetical protein n=1 Tax=Rhizobium leguminosarum TaxID=384 RepID=UPI001C98B165|nr:hypothetical protein [Rhizobium leguminosarum]MBY5359885.1 hypothetical protein [Rhizobium leguminosarum]